MYGKRSAVSKSIRSVRIDVHFADRVGIAHEILAVVSRQGLDLTAVEVDPPHLFLDVPALAERGFNRLREDLLAVGDVISAEPVTMLPDSQFLKT